MSDAILVFNAGSSSIKFALFETSDRGDLRLSCRGLLDEDQADPRLVVTDTSGHVLLERQRTRSDAVEGRLFGDVVDWAESQCKALAIVGHRVVHGGRKFMAPVRISQEVIAELDGLTPLAPLHQPRCLNPIRKINSLRPNIPQFACFDTAFHCGIEPPVSRFALPRRFEEIGIRRYGFHGLSYEYIANRLAALSPALAASRTVVAHLGNGSSLCAMRNGRSIDTTMGLTALDGIVMGTRCGAIDPGVLLYLLQEEGMSANEVQHLLYEESGLLGVSGVSADMRALQDSRDPAAREAIDLFAFRAAAEIVRMANTLAGLDAVVFTGGIGEHAAGIRRQICDHLAWLGVRLDATANANGQQRIAATDSSVDVLVIATSEESTIARHCVALLNSEA
jgi:acetate kinase